MAQQETTPKVKEDQPPAYLGNDKPPDYYDVRRHEAITPPPVDIASPNNVTAVHFPPHDDTPVDHVSPPDNATAHIPLTTTTNGTSHTVHSSNTATVNTRYPSENVIFVQPPTYNSHFYNVNESQDERHIGCCSWKFLIIMSTIATIIVPCIGLHALIWSCISYHNRHNEFGQRALKVALIMCTVSYVVIFFLVFILTSYFTLSLRSY